MKRHTETLPVDASVLCELLRLGRFQSEPAHKVLFQRGEAAQGVYVIVSGKIELSLDGNLQHPLTQTAGLGDIAGLPAAITGKPYSLTATTAVPCELWYVARGAIVGALRNNPHLGRALLEILAHEVQDLRELWRELPRQQCRKAILH